MEERIIFYIDAHYLEPITMEALADYCGFSKFYLSRQFKNLNNCSFRDYLNSKRMITARYLLDSTDLPITSIAMQSGFQSISSFNRVFKETYGCSPKQYRTK